MHRRITLSALVCAAALSAPAMATTYPLTLTDTSGQTLTLQQEPKRIVVQDGRDILTLALLDRANPFDRLVAWNNLLKKSDAATWDILQSKWPAAKNIIDMGFSDKGEVNLESVIAKRPDLMIAQLRSKPSLNQTGVLDKLKALNVPVLFIDTMLKPVENTPKSVTLLGKPSTAKAKPSNIPIIISSIIRPFWPRRRRWNPSRWYSLRPRPASMGWNPAASPMLTSVGARW